MKRLSGGRKNKIFRSNDNTQVYRPSGSWSKAVHKLLIHLQAVQFNAIPQSFGFDSDYEAVSYVEGDVYNYPLTGAIASAEALNSAAILLRQYHDNTVSFLQNSKNLNLTWLYPPKNPQEVICHGDYSPYNVTLKENKVVGIFDFDTAHPAPRIWDIAYSVYCWAPFKTHSHDALGNLKNQMLRAKQFCDSYGLSQEDKKILVDTMITRIQALIDFIQERADKGCEKFQLDLKKGHHLAYQKDINYLDSNKEYITDFLIQ